MNFWLFKSEPSCYSIDDLKKEQKTFWDGVRNYQARNFLKNKMQIDDLILFYHSQANPPGVVGLAKVASLPYADPTAFDPLEKHFDNKSDKTHPTWFGVDILFVEKFPRLISLAKLRQCKELEGLALLQKGSRLSVQPVNSDHFKFILSLC